MPPKIKNRVSPKNLVCWTKDNKVICVSKGTFKDYVPKKKAVVKKTVKKAESPKPPPKKKAVKKAESPKPPPKKKAVKKTESPKPPPKKKAVKVSRNTSDEFETLYKFLRTPSKRTRGFLSKIGFTEREQIDLFNSQKLNDFYPTPKRCLDERAIKYSDKILECTAGVGFVVNYMKEINPKAEIDAYELNPGAVEIADKLLGKGVIVRKDFLKLDVVSNDYDFIFCNPPFTQGAGNREPYYLKFLIKVLQIMEKNKGLKEQGWAYGVTVQFLCPKTIFNKIQTFKEDDMVESYKFFKKCPAKTLKKYCEELGYSYKRLMKEDLFMFRFMKDCQFETTGVESANLYIVADGEDW